MPAPGGAYRLPASLEKRFLVGRHSTTRTPDGYREGFDNVGEIIGILADATTREVILAQQVDYVITHTLIQHGAPRAQLSDRLELVNPPDGVSRYYRVQQVNNPGLGNVYTLYELEAIRHPVETPAGA